MTLDNNLEEIKKANTIVIVVHENPDGDAIGSALAMKLALKQLNKEADVIIPEYPSAFSFLPGVEKIKKEFNNNISVFTGQSGAGKSTLLNHLNEELNIKTAPISKALGRGKHTTRHTELIKIESGYVADTPGFSALNLEELSKENIRDNFIEFNEYKDECKYRDCMHLKEDECGIKNKVEDKIILESRYNNYVKFINERM